MIECISAITLAIRDMARSLRFYEALGFECIHGGQGAAFSSLRAGASFLNLVVRPDGPGSNQGAHQGAGQAARWWGRIIFHVADVDALHALVIASGYKPDTSPRDAEWGERFFHLTDPDAHELSFARPLR